MGVPEPHRLQNAANAEFAGMRNSIAAIESEGNIKDQKRRREWPRQGGVTASWKTAGGSELGRQGGVTPEA
jgi:hypothetical protein